jgi:hypothetical protein
VNQGTLSPAFTANTTFYTVEVENKKDKINVSAKAADNKATVTGAGNNSLFVGSNEILITVTATDGTTKTYIHQLFESWKLRVTSQFSTFIFLERKTTIQ